MGMSDFDEMDDATLVRSFALVSVLTESGAAVCTFANPLRQCIKRRRSDSEHLEVWLRPNERWERLTRLREVADDESDEESEDGAKFRTRSRPAASLVVPPTHVVALHDYAAQEDDEMSLKLGDVVRVWYRGADHDWWQGEYVKKLVTNCDDTDSSNPVEPAHKTGLFPSSFCNGVPRSD